MYDNSGLLSTSLNKFLISSSVSIPNAFSNTVAGNFLFLSIFTEITPFLEVSNETQDPFLVLISAPPKI